MWDVCVLEGNVYVCDCMNVYMGIYGVCVPLSTYITTLPITTPQIPPHNPQAKDLAQKAHDTCDIPTIRAAADTTLGRALHAQGHLSEALKCYVTAARLQPNNLLPRFGQSQVIVLRRDYNNVASLLLQLLKEAPGWIDALRLLWALSSKVSPAILGGTLEHFKVACKKDPQDPQLREMFGDLQTMTNPAEALRCYEEAIALHCAQGGGGVENGVGGENGGHGGLDGVPPRLLNNTAVLVLQTGDAQRAQRFMNTALEVIFVVVVVCVWGGYMSGWWW